MTQTEKEQEALGAIQHSTDDQLYEMLEEVFAGEGLCRQTARRSQSFLVNGSNQ